MMNMENRRDNGDRAVLTSLSLNAVALSGIGAILLVAFYYQLAFDELPCPLWPLAGVQRINSAIRQWRWRGRHRRAAQRFPHERGHRPPMTATTLMTAERVPHGISEGAGKVLRGAVLSSHGRYRRRSPGR